MYSTKPIVPRKSIPLQEEIPIFTLPERMAEIEASDRALYERVISVWEQHGATTAMRLELEDAGLLVVRGLAYETSKCRDLDSEHLVHTVDFGGAGEVPTCTCDQFAHHPQWSHYGPTCPHILAQLLAYFEGIELAPEPIPFEGEPVLHS